MAIWMYCVVTGPLLKTCVCTCVPGATDQLPCTHTVHSRCACVVHGPDGLFAVCTSYVMSWAITSCTVWMLVGAASLTRNQKGYVAQNG